jgi:hypothetical protein
MIGVDFLNRTYAFDAYFESILLYRVPPNLFSTASVIFSNSDAHPPSVSLPSKAEGPASEVYRINDEPADAFSCLGTVTGDVGKSADAGREAWKAAERLHWFASSDAGQYALARCTLHALRDQHTPSGPKGPGDCRMPFVSVACPSSQ